MKIADFFAAIGFEVDDKALSDVDKKLESVQKNTAKLGAALAAALFAMDRFAAGTVKAAVALTNFNMQTGLSTDKLQQWQAAAQLSNMATDAAEVATSVQSLQQNLTQIRLGAGNAAPFQLLGIDIKNKDAFDVLDQMRERIKGLSPSMASNMLEQMGLGANFINVLKLSREEFDNLGKSLVRSKATTAAIMRIGNAINELKLQAAKFKDDLVAKLEPVFNVIINVLQRFGKIIERTIWLMEEYPTAAKAVAAGLAIVFVPLRALTVLFRPLTLAIAAFLLILEDIAVFAQGGNSALGRLLSAFSDLYNQLDAAFLTPFMEYWEKIANFIEQKIITPMKWVGQKIDNTLPDVPTLPQAEEGSARQKIDKYIMEMLADPDSWFGGLMRAMPSGETPQYYQEQLNKMSAPVFNNNFVIHGGDAAGIAKGVANTMQDQLDYSLTDTNNGVAY